MMMNIGFLLLVASLGNAANKDVAPAPDDLFGLDDVKLETGFGKVDDDGYEWPTIYECADDMLDASLLMYPIAALRDLARNEPEKLKENGRAILKEPTTATELVGHLTDNRVALEESLGGFDLLVDVLETIKQRQTSIEKRKTVATLVDFSDDNSQRELVYAIGVDNSRKRVTVAFRGSTTGKDWGQNAQVWMKRIDNPLAKIRGQPKSIRFHQGFYDYLFYKDEGDDDSKYAKIIKQLQELFSKEKNRGYKLFVTGHSLGGALATLFSFMIAAEGEDGIPHPVTCVSIASPFVGGSSFREAFQYLEATGRLQHLRVVNHKDVVTTIPFASLNFGLYKHVGLELKLFSKQKPDFVFPRVINMWKRAWGQSFIANFDLQASNNHKTSEYSSRLDAARGELSNEYLNDKYAGKGIAEFLRRKMKSWKEASKSSVESE